MDCAAGLQPIPCFVFANRKLYLLQLHVRALRQTGLEGSGVHSENTRVCLQCINNSLTSVMAQENLSAVLHAKGDLRMVGARL